MPHSRPPPRPRRGPPSRARARRTPAAGLADTEARVDMRAVRAYRLGRVREHLRAHDYAGCVLYDPINVRYATGARNMTVWCLHNPVRYCFIATEGPVVLFDFHNCQHLSAGLETVDEARRALSWYYFGAGPRVQEKAKRWAAEIADLVRAHGGGNRRLALDHCDPAGAAALAEHGLEVRDGQEVLERARAVKSDDELALMGVAMAACEAGMARMRAALEPGMSENALWSILHQVNIAMGGEWIETRLLASGGRTNPWFQECGERIIRPGELVSFDTDLIGPFGYCADISRTYFCGPGRPSDEQRRLYRLAWEQILHNMDLLKPGLSFRELAERAFELPESCAPNRYSVLVHGIGMCDEYPHCAYREDMERGGYEGVFEAGMAVCVESYVGEAGGAEGVKLEQQVLITERGVELLSTYPFEDELLVREI
ncbi:MAG: M24 family metallopeptidase [Kiloniellaceae bacterium]